MPTRTAARKALRFRSTHLCGRLEDRLGGVEGGDKGQHAQRMQAKGLIRYKRGRIVILDRKGLEACACDCYHVMHDEKLPHALGVNL